MARQFDDAATEYLQRSGTPVSAAPMTIAAWFKTDTVQYNGIVGLDGSGDYAFLITQPDWGGGGKSAIELSDGSSWPFASSTTAYSTNTWHHGAGVITSATSYAAFLDGASKGTETTSCVVTPTTSTNIGTTGGDWGDLMSGAVAEAAIWNVALTDAEVAILGAGYSPLFVRPQSLVAYWPLIRDEDQDRIGGYDLTAYNTPTVAAHPPIIYPAPYFQGFITTAAVGDFPETTTPTPETFTSNDTAHLVTMPSTVDAGDLLIVLFAHDDGSNTVTTPSGWTQRSQDADTGENVNFGVWVKVADGTEDSTTVDFVTDGSEQAVAIVYRVTNWYGTLAGVEVGTAADGSSDSPDPPSLTPSWGAEDTLWIAGFGNDSEELATAYPSNYTGGIHGTTGTGSGRCGAGSARRELNASPENPGAFTMNTSDEWVAQTIAIRPAEAVAADVLNRGVSNIESGIVASQGGGYSGLHPIEQGFVS